MNRINGLANFFVSAKIFNRNYCTIKQINVLICMYWYVPVVNYGHVIAPLRINVNNVTLSKDRRQPCSLSRKIKKITTLPSKFAEPAIFAGAGTG